MWRMMARLGMRAPEVIAIRLDDIDWRAGELRVRGKGQRYDRLSVPPDVGEAIAAYVREERISAARTLARKSVVSGMSVSVSVDLGGRRGMKINEHKCVKHL